MFDRDDHPFQDKEWVGYEAQGVGYDEGKGKEPGFVGYETS